MIPTLTLNNGVQLAALGFGVFQTPPEETTTADFELTSEQLAAIDRLDTGRRGGPEPTDITLAAFGRDIPED
jgi:diketogulonate reductase-like aldo/keto reductase